MRVVRPNGMTMHKYGLRNKNKVVVVVWISMSMSMLMSMLVSMSMMCFVPVHGRAIPRTAGIFGFGKNKEEETETSWQLRQESHHQHSQPQFKRPPPNRQQQQQQQHQQQQHQQQQHQQQQHGLPTQQRQQQQRQKLLPPPPRKESHTTTELEGKDSKDTNNNIDGTAGESGNNNNNNYNSHTHISTATEIEGPQRNTSATEDEKHGVNSDEQQHQPPSPLWNGNHQHHPYGVGLDGLPPPPPGYLPVHGDQSALWDPHQPPPHSSWYDQQQPQQPYYQIEEQGNFIDAGYHHHHQSQQGGTNNMDMDRDMSMGGSDNIINYEFERVRQELDDSMSHTHELLTQVQNLTVAISSMQTQEDMHLDELDVLAQLVLEAETDASSERNAALEYRANCTALDHALATIHDELDEWKDRCSTLENKEEDQTTNIAELKQRLSLSEAEAEQLSVVIENARLLDERDLVLMKKQKKSVGFLGWLFGGLIREGGDEDELKAAQALARSTLLRALQTERNNVEELESTVSILQQNNSAISEMVASRDSLIYELNDRVAVFEEDKLVLKAALRQLQKEMKEEAPKSQKLVDALNKAQEEIIRLNAEIETLVSTHMQQLTQLQSAIGVKQNRISETESNLTVIGTYVDKLEERLGDFSLARRDIQHREDRCNQMEEKAIHMEKERDDLKLKVDVFAGEQQELKTLFQDLVMERATLQEGKAFLQIERDELILDKDQLQKAVGSLEVDLQELEGMLDDWKAKVCELETEMEDLEEAVTLEQEKNLLQKEPTHADQVQDSNTHIHEYVANDEEPEVTAANSDCDENDDSRDETQFAPTGYTNDTDEEGAGVAHENDEKAIEQDESKERRENSDFFCNSDKSLDSSDVDDEIAALESLIEPLLSDSTPASIVTSSSPQKELLLKEHPINRPSPPCGRSNDHPQKSWQRPVYGSLLPPQRKNVPFRQVRKAFSKATGVHGLFTPPSLKAPVRTNESMSNFPTPKKAPLEEINLHRSEQQ